MARAALYTLLVVLRGFFYLTMILSMPALVLNCLFASAIDKIERKLGVKPMLFWDEMTSQ